MIYSILPQKFSSDDHEEIKSEKAKLQAQVIDHTIQEAEAMLKEAKRQSDLLIQNTAVQSKVLYEDMKQKGHKEGHQEGLQQGKAEGYEQGMLEAQHLIEEAEAICHQALQEKERLFQDAEPVMVELSLMIAQKILKETVKVNPLYILELLKVGVDAISATKDIKIQVSEDDFQTVMNHKEELLKVSDEIQHIEISKNVSLTKAQCIIETAFGSIDCSLDTQLEGIKKELSRLI